MPELTVVVHARDDAGRAPRLDRISAALAAQTLPRSEWCAVVVDATTAGLPAVPDDVAATVRVPAAAGRAAALNAGWAAATAPFVAFVAADLAPAPLWAESMLRALRRGRRLATGGWQPHPDATGDAGWASHRLWACAQERALVTADQLGARREDLAAVGGFDDRYDADPVRADVDLAARLVDAGVDPHWARHAVVWHEVAAGLPAATGGDVAAALDVLAEHPRARARLLPAGLLWHRRSGEVLLAAAGVGLAAATRDRRPLLLAAPWLHERTCLTPRAGGPRRRWAVLPGVFAVDLTDALTTTAARLRPRHHDRV